MGLIFKGEAGIADELASRAQLSYSTFGVTDILLTAATIFGPSPDDPTGVIWRILQHAKLRRTKPVVAPAKLAKLVQHAPIPKLGIDLSPTAEAARENKRVKQEVDYILYLIHEAQREGVMGLDIGGILGGVSQIFGGNQNPYFQGISGVAQIAQAFVPPAQTNYLPTYGPAPAPMVPAVRVANVPARVMGGSSIMALSNELITAGGKLLGTLGIPVRSAASFSSTLVRAVRGMSSLAARTPGLTILGVLTSLGLTAYEANLVVAHTAQRKRGRRMNPANSKALRRAARRIKSFHKLCTHTDVLRTRGRSSARASRCGTCKKSPCRC